jgi:hypothetical protein
MKYQQKVAGSLAFGDNDLIVNPHLAKWDFGRTRTIWNKDFMANFIEFSFIQKIIKSKHK